jgi:DNA-binding winged helix-turn-helix (wHTH) protein
VEKRYFQYFWGEEFFQQRRAFDRSSAAAGATADANLADHHAHRARRGKRTRARARHRRRRLHRQAIRALLRRASPERVAMVLTIGDLELDREKKRVSRASRPVDLGPTEFRLLEFLMERAGRVFSREQLLDGVWGSDVYIDERTVDVHVGRLRKALNRGHATDPIRTVRGAGYSLDDRFGKAG